MIMSVFFLSSCSQLTEEDARKSAIEAACPHFQKFDKECSDVQPDEYEIKDDGSRFYAFFLSKEPEYIVTVLVPNFGWIQVSVWDDKIKSKE